MPTPTNPDTVRSFVFGVEDSLVSTIGLVSGIAAAGMARGPLIATGIVLIFVEAFSMAAGSLISDNSAKEYAQHGAVPISRSYWQSAVMFLSYFLSGFVILAPYLFMDATYAFGASIAVAMIALFILGAYIGRLSGIPPIRRGITIMSIGGAAIMIGVGVGMIANRYLLI